MSFLGRIAARASAPALGGGERGARSSVTEAVPVLTSKSPLVRFDQRLTLPGFAEMAPVSPGVGTGALEADGLAAPNEAETPAATRESGAAVTDVSLPSSAPVRPVASDDAQALARGPRSFAPDASFAPLSSTVPAAFASGDERPNSELETRQRGDVSDSAAFPPLASARAVAELTPAVDFRARVDASPQSDSAPDSPATPAPTESRAPARTVLDAVARLDAWLRTESRDVDPALPLAALPAAGSQPFDAAESAAAPTISIGKLEIEVVPPALEARFRSAAPSQERRQRPVQRAPRPVPSGGARGFGWRQR
jgi:hypothetical protein